MPKLGRKPFPYNWSGRMDDPAVHIGHHGAAQREAIDARQRRRIERVLGLAMTYQLSLRQQGNIVRIARGEIEIVQYGDDPVTALRQTSCVAKHQMLMRD